MCSLGLRFFCMLGRSPSPFALSLSLAVWQRCQDSSIMPHHVACASFHCDLDSGCGSNSRKRRQRRRCFIQFSVVALLPLPPSPPPSPSLAGCALQKLHFSACFSPALAPSLPAPLHVDNIAQSRRFSIVQTETKKQSRQI